MEALSTRVDFRAGLRYTKIAPGFASRHLVGERLLMQSQPSQDRQGGGSLGRLVPLSIRGKIILPYLILTLAVAVIGTYVVTNLVAGSLDERLTNQLLEAGRVVSDSLARREIEYLEAARLVAFTRGLDEALQASDQARVAALVQPAAAATGVECLIVTDAEGHEMSHVLRQGDGSYLPVTGQPDASGLRIVQALLAGGDPNSLPQRGLGLHPAVQRYYYFTAIPVGQGDRVIGVVVVGASLDALAAHFKATSLADIILYFDNGRAVATTFALEAQPAQAPAGLDEFSISPQLYQVALNSLSSTAGENLIIHRRPYRLARGPLRVSDDTLGAFAVALPSNFIIQAGAASRMTYSVLFTIAMACVIGIGYLISQRISHPLGRLVSTSQAVAEGDLKQRTGLGGTDEIGVLAATFDEMTGRLEERTEALEQSLQAQRETASRLQAILASIGDGVLFKTMDGDITPLNNTALTLLEEMAANFALSPLQDLSEESDQAEAQHPPWRVESRRLQIGKKVISTNAAAVRTEDGRRVGTVIVLRDVTAEAEAERLKDAFVAHVSHELRTPLTSIKGYCGLLIAGSGDRLDAQERGFLQTISRNSDNLTEMINGLLDFSEIEAKGRLGLQRRPVSLSGLVEEIAAEWREPMADKSLAFRVEIAPDLPSIAADSKRLRWAIVNLIRNAWQYTPDGGQVTLQLSARNGHVVLDVIDTGIGIPRQDQPQLFTRFYRAPGQALAEETRGLGLGLYVTRAIVEAHGGEIHVISEQGAGSTFSVVLPAGPE